MCGKEKDDDMGTTIRPELSEKNKYWLERHRYYELKHFCLQYPIWKKAYRALDGFKDHPIDLQLFSAGSYGSPTERCAMAKAYYHDRMEMIENTAKETDQELQSYILKGVTECLSYDVLKARLEIPCSKDTYYDRYRRFFWLLNKMRG